MSAGMQVLVCPGPTGRHTRCPVLAGEPCPLVAGADVVVVSHACGDEPWRRLPAAHAAVHPGTPVCIEDRSRSGGRPAAPFPAVPEDRADLVAFLRHLVEGGCVGTKVPADGGPATVDPAAAGGAP
jgi:hypothetical protein